jgi:hypothetical protein
MFCDSCGAGMAVDQRFCGSCGKRIVGMEPVPASPFRFPSAEGRFERHIRMVGFLTLAASLVSLLWGFGLLHLNLGHLTMWHRPIRILWIPYTSGLWSFACAVMGIVAGAGLLQRRFWARPLAMLVNTLQIFNLPFGTALAIYTLWVMLPWRWVRGYR